MSYAVNDIRYIHFKGEVIGVVFCEDGLWRDASGCIYAFMDMDYAEDRIVRMGVYPLCLPLRWSINKLAKGHDYAYSSPAYQMYHTRLEADKALKDMIAQYGKGFWRYMATPFYYIARIFGRFYWENDKTR